MSTVLIVVIVIVVLVLLVVAFAAGRPPGTLERERLTEQASAHRDEAETRAAKASELSEQQETKRAQSTEAAAGADRLARVAEEQRAGPTSSPRSRVMLADGRAGARAGSPARADGRPDRRGSVSVSLIAAGATRDGRSDSARRPDRERRGGPEPQARTPARAAGGLPATEMAEKRIATDDQGASWPRSRGDPSG